MPIPRYFVVAESRHELQNPTSEEKLVLLGERLDLRPGARVLDVASGRGGPALLLARTFECSIVGIELSPDFHATAAERAAERGLSHLVSFTLGDASQVDLPRDAYDAALCLGASFVYGGLGQTVAALAAAVRPGGHVVVGEPYWRCLPLPDDYADRDDPWTTLEETVNVFEESGLPVVSVIASSEDDWDRYETLHWLAVEEWLAVNASDPSADEIRTRHRRWKSVYLRHGRDYCGWAIFVAWKRP
ncbi:MAG TPA: methyltransferase domain-containing protein [Gaiellaceae bacterium]|nr:methyltransferase domain-containing protein [Gaiellaceae bacterium]